MILYMMGLKSENKVEMLRKKILERAISWDLDLINNDEKENSKKEEEKRRNLLDLEAMSFIANINIFYLIVKPKIYGTLLLKF